MYSSAHAHSMPALCATCHQSTTLHQLQRHHQLSPILTHAHAPTTPAPAPRPAPAKKKKSKRNLALLSFGTEAEAEEQELAAVAETGKIRSAHDVLQDER